MVQYGNLIGPDSDGLDEALRDAASKGDAVAGIGDWSSWKLVGQHRKVTLTIAWL